MLRLIFIVLALTSTPAFYLHAATEADAQARFLAGLGVEDSALEPLAREPAWQTHASEFQTSWLDVEQRQLGPIRAWMPVNLPRVYESSAPLFYLFSGPDFLYANAFFPNASTYILCGQEPVGELPRAEDLSPTERAAALANLRKSLNAILSYSFFITADMKEDLVRSKLTGTVPVMMVFLARSGCQIHSLKKVWLTKEGALTEEKTGTPGVRWEFTGTRGKKQELFYFKTDLSNWGIRSDPSFMKFCEMKGRGSALVKSASYLMHMSDFSASRDFILQNADHLVQDDSGVPWKYLAQGPWLMRLFGHYPGPIDLFKEHDQADLRQAFQTENVGELTFGVGYQWRPGVSSILVGTSLKSAPRAVPIQE